MSEDFRLKFAAIPQNIWLEQSGLEIFQKMIAGEYPQAPIAGTLDFQLAKIENGRAEGKSL